MYRRVNLSEQRSTTQLTTITAAINPIVALVLNATGSQHTRRAYQRALTDFITWHVASGQNGLTKASVAAHITHLRDTGVGASSINQRLAAIRKLALECADNGLIDHATAQAIARVAGVKETGKRLGNWLTLAQAQAMLDTPDGATNKGARDRALLSVLIGCGLRREEAAALTFAHIQQREARWVIVNLLGKGNKLRSVPMPSWAKVSTDHWAQRLPIAAGPVFRAMRRGDVIQPDGLSAQGIRDVVKLYGAEMGMPELAPHDLRRTFAKLAHKGLARLEQIQLSLGHASLQTTESYLGIEQDLTDAPGDRLGLH
jgi:site-specific recombinase XerD